MVIPSGVGEGVGWVGPVCGDVVAMTIDSGGVLCLLYIPSDWVNVPGASQVPDL